ncbi:hypothetical protein CIK95_03235 [Prevotella sp. P5-108]|uniref:Ig-like domain-containing protein n=1 Tax=Prevotella sp. P5-108 TaxID=2024225 RepID=UPI000B97B9F0|nr:Ig-like domain-containing protein [Prevotella sp. P5-108]OYP66392.1 hypothetical protein CIK95_03235 [Prevotella sp. P5-108]
MTKHLRLLMLALLAIICTGGVKAAVGDTYKLVTPTDELKAGDVIVIGCKQYAKAMGAQKTNNRAAVDITITNGVFSFVDGIEELTLKKVNEKWQLVTSDGKYLYQPDKNKLQSTDDASNTNTQASISFTSVGNSTICFGKFTSFIKLNINPYCFSCYASSTSNTYIVQIYKKQDSGKTATTIAFAEGIENATVTVKDGETFKGYTATCTTEGAKGDIKYSSSNTDVATVDKSTGAVTMGSKYGKTVITAQFIGTGGYANSNKISYTIEHKGAYAFYESFDKCDGKAGWSGGAAAAGAWDQDKLDNAWTRNGTVLLGDGCIRIGKNASSVSTPTIKVAGKAKLTFKAGAWQGDNTKVKIEISEGTLTYGDNTPAKSVTISPTQGKWDDYEMIITGATSFTLTFSNSTKSYRFFLDEVMVKEIAAADVTLDEERDNVVEAAENANVTLKRTLYADGGWNTLCLPFSLTDEQTKAAFGDDVELRTLESVSGNTLTFAKATGITAGVPCLIKVSKVAKDNTYTFTGVSVKAIKADAKKYVMDESRTFVGIYAPMDVATKFEKDGNALFLGEANKFYKAKAGTTMNAFRAFFLVPASTDTQALRAVIDGTTTGIDDLNIDTVKADGRVYNLNGQCVGYSLEGLKAGIYIQNGKKVIKK